MIEKEFVPYDRALRMKALGFNEPCISFYSKNGKHNYDVQNPCTNIGSWSDQEHYCSAPTFSQAFRWFREKYNLYIKPDWCWTGDSQFVRFQIWKKRDIEGVFSKSVSIFIDGNPFKGEDENFYYKAELACLDKLIEIVEQQKKER